MKTPQPMKPTESDIHETITLIQAKLAKTAINRAVNKPLSEGYSAALKILVDSPDAYPKQIIDAPESVQGRAIAELAWDYLQGDCSQKILTGVPLK